MNHTFSKRESAMLLILVLILLAALYYKVIFEPVQDRIAEADLARGEAESAMVVELAKAEKLAAMRAELEAAQAAGTSASAEIPEYDNLERVMALLDGVLSAASEYDLTFAPLVTEDALVQRPISMSFSCTGYAMAKDIITDLYNSRYRCAVQDIDITSTGASEAAPNVTTDQLQVQLTVTFFEQLP